MICQLCERHETDGYLCPGCSASTARRLDRMPLMYTALAAFLAPQARPAQHGSSGKGGPAPLPVSEHVLALRGPGGLVGVLEDWRSAMQADRGWKEPAVTGLVETRLHRAARALSLNLGWIAASWPMAGTFAEEIRDLERDVASVVGPHDRAERGTRLGKCPAVDPSGAICGAVLRHYPGERAVTCRWCGCAFEPHEWGVLREWIDQDAANHAEEVAS
ncbi:hypothetical protein [Streptomyces sp. NPDC008121]|uniref:hypothetical protein n=1 Tax=Streptomyces sp. NPDC008121 TaxID=3364809 RepID=UPI0036EDF314